MIMRILTIVLVVAGAFHATTSAQPAQRFEILITEIFADPAPAIGLPGSEYVEIRNVSSRTINIKDWKLGDANSFGTIAINFNLPADSAIILCTNSAIPAFTSLAMAVAVSNFPSLDNEGDLISLTSKEGTTIHAVRYEKSWFKNDLKSNGGWSLEMIDAKNPCAGFTNWMASVSPIGGTPGKINSVNGKNADDRPPGLLRTYSIDSLTVIAVFDEPVDSVSASQVTKYALNKEPVKPVTAVAVAPLFTEVVMKFAVPLMKEIIYQLTVSGISDCMGNLIQAPSSKRRRKYLP